MQTNVDVIYDVDHKLGVDVYVPDQPAIGAVIDIHGGGWFRGDKSKDADLGAIFAAAGYIAFIPNYRFTPEAYYPAPLVDMDGFLTWMRASDYEFDRSKIAVFGSSAGGNMSVEMAIKYGLPAVSWSGILDIDNWLDQHQDVVASQTNTSDFNGASAEINQTGANDGFYKWFVTNYFNGHMDQYQRATPYRRVTSATGPMFLANSLNEFVPNSGVLQMANALTANGVPHMVMMVTGSKHAKGYMDKVLAETMLFLKAQLQ